MPALLGIQLTEPDVTCLTLCAGFAAWCLVASWVTGTHSHVDRLWSITPAVYTLVYAHASGGDARCVLMAAAVVAWGARLTSNFARKGGYGKGEQDYRWPVLQKFTFLRNPVVWQVFNVGFIAGYQNLLLFWIVMPAAAAFRNKGAPLNFLDAAAAILFFCFVALETAADNQQWLFQRQKRGAARIPKTAVVNDDYARGFLTHGLFEFSRHPNFFAEQAVWISFYLFAVASGVGSNTAMLSDWKAWVLPCKAGMFQLMLLFQGSTRFTEYITSNKYPEYKAYTKVTSFLIPFPRFGVLSAPAPTNTQKSVAAASTYVDFTGAAATAAAASDVVSPLTKRAATMAATAIAEAAAAPTSPLTPKRGAKTGTAATAAAASILSPGLLSPGGKSRLPAEAKAMLQEFWDQHGAYPTNDEKDALAAKSGLSVGQCANFFANTRAAFNKQGKALPGTPGKKGR
eukprot:CAMPEP_0197596416 /NCGR_PEP_ID=MMETSP1326-20131121/25004_1 /TAXON_ID=1155430 /ORGANISM="Genus nov. species nov., Strain RCC2288" /LENGTH=456 /DNA_ID=CAMNT_0043162905 /DNA_START=178 /DNA_END=1548 /DNA_ORIENTATION=-